MSESKSNVMHMYNHDKFKGFKIDDELSYTDYDRKGEHKMNKDDSMETLFKEIKIDMREREERTRREISEREERFEKQLSKFAQESFVREERYLAEVREREKRINDLISNVEQNMLTHSTKMESIQTQNLWGNLALFIGMLAIVITLIIIVL